MALLGNDVLLCGGSAKEKYLSSCDLYNASIYQWVAAATIPPLPVVLAYFPMTTLHTRPYVFGGYAKNMPGIVNTVYTFDTSNAWATRKPMQQAVRESTAVALDTNTALVCGGSGLGVLSACFSYAATEDVWSPAAPMITARCMHGMAVYKGLFAADHDLHNYSGCAQVACLSMADMRMWEVRSHLLKCCRSTFKLGAC
jgi:hypothetical protein